jgi:hypothetical protein
MRYPRCSTVCGVSDDLECHSGGCPPGDSRNAASVAVLLLTTEVMIAEAPKDESDHVHPAPGGMGGMDM